MMAFFRPIPALSLAFVLCLAPAAAPAGAVAPYSAPELAGLSTWLNSPSLTLQALRGRVVLIDFWAYSCVNCVRTLPYLSAWDRKYRDKGLTIIGVHSPEFDFEKQPDNVRAALSQYGIRYPVALDNSMETWNRFGNRYWPAHYLIDRAGRVVYTHFGEGRYDVTENAIRAQLGLKPDPGAKPEPPSYSQDQTPETYLGYERTNRFGGTESLARDREGHYRLPDILPHDNWALGGVWSSGPENLASAGKGAVLRLNFKARKVFLVLGSRKGTPVRATLTLNGFPVGSLAGKDAPGGRLTVARHALYELIDQKTAKTGVLDIRTDDTGLEAYAFTFGQ
ncbi:thioredoxin family protein [Paludibacterium paludis]|uniref:Thioredoxin domain-containing protein n=1 Tax=Paludibacterium paludis TaxID=1225769 RepID=A0A918NY51_9NEIS|nr:thioredoxin family protein [Paludibacterium paludis]GGY06236.1 hypothetical protein GCM10011289_05870 [Paludibacterium paludis]